MSIESKLQAIIAAANTTTGETDTTLTDAVQRLVDGYGGGGGEVYYSSDKYGPIYCANFIMPDRENLNSGPLSDLYAQSPHLEHLYVGANYKLGSAPFHDCANLITAKIKSCSASEMFWGCTSLKYCTVYNDCGALHTWTFDNCKSLLAVILPDNAVLPLDNTNAFGGSGIKNSGGDGRIYVPSALVDSYKSATNWSSFASNILAIEDNLDVVGDYL